MKRIQELMMKIKLLAVFAFLSVNISLVLFNLPVQSLFPASNALIALNSMALSLILAARFSWIDFLVGGPDKAYVMHRWLGYIAVVSLSLHWVSAKASGAALIPSLSHLGEESGEFAAILILILVLISALKLIPYHLWKKSHLLMGPLFIIAVFHSFFSESPFVAYSLTWFIMLVLSFLATISWIKTLYNQKTSLVSSKVVAVKRMSGAVDIELKCSAPLMINAGQFASISVNKNGLSEQHPFSVIKTNESSKLRFIIANAGDYTQRLNSEIQIGDEVIIHKVAGKFTPEYKLSRKRQVWVAAGVGITPFLAALAHMKSDQGQAVDLIYAPGNRLDSYIINELQRYQQQLAQFNLCLLDNNERLTAQHFNALALDSSRTDLYLCGPEGLKAQAILLWNEDKLRRAKTLQKSYFSVLRQIFTSKGKVYSEDFDFRNALGGNSHHILQQVLNRSWGKQSLMQSVEKSMLDIKSYLGNDRNLTQAISFKGK
jgi:predicted ferric reductase